MSLSGGVKPRAMQMHPCTGRAAARAPRRPGEGGGSLRFLMLKLMMLAEPSLAGRIVDWA